MSDNAGNEPNNILKLISNKEQTKKFIVIQVEESGGEFTNLTVASNMSNKDVLAALEISKMIKMEQLGFL